MTELNKALSNTSNTKSICLDQISNTILKKLTPKTNQWGMKINIDKTTYTLFHKKYRTQSNQFSDTIEVKLNDNLISKIEHPTLLGIKLDKHLNFEHHFVELRKSLTTKLNLFYRLSSNLQTT